jgi:polyribonucleotide nucleotidyltransferase
MEKIDDIMEQKKQAEWRPPSNTEELRDSIAQVREDLMAGKITNKEARARIKEANKVLQQVRRNLHSAP